MDDFWTRWTARVALALYVAAVAGMVHARHDRLARWVRPVWAAGCLVFLVHVACAFHEVHGWSHQAAFAHVARRTEEFVGVSSGVGLYLNYAFTAAWAADALWWWARPESHHRRPAWLSAALHGFLAFMAFNATVVFAAGLTRWLGLAACALLASLWWNTRPRAAR